MAIVNIYRSFEGNEYDEYTVQSGKTLKEAFPDIDFENTLIFSDGRPIDENFILSESNIVCLRTFPSGKVGQAISTGAKKVWNAVTTGVSKVGSFFSGVWNSAKSTISGWIGVDVSVSANYGTSGSSGGGTTASETETIPSIKGARNQSHNGRPIPLVLGTSLYTPMYGGNPYTVISGTDGEAQCLYAMYILGYKNLDVKNIKLGELDLASNSGGVTDGTIPIDGAGRFKGVVELELCSSDRELSLYPQKVVQESLQFQLIHPDDDSGNWLISERFSATYPHKVQVEVSFNNLIKFDDSGNTLSTSVAIKLEISFNGGASYEPFGAFAGATSYSQDGTSTFTRAKNKNLRFIAERTLTYAEAMNCLNDVAQIRIQRLTRESTDTKIQDRCYVTGIRTWVFDKEKSKAAGVLVPQSPVEPRIRSKTVRLAMKINASESFSDLNGTINQLSMILTSKCRTWNGAAWSDAETPTANPASVMLKTMQSPMLGQYAYNDDKIDLLKLGELYTFCEQNDFRVGGVLTSQRKLSEVIDTILSTCRSMRVLNQGKYSVVIDKPRTIPVTILNNHNFLRDSRKNTKEFRELPDGLKIKFINRRLNYTEDEIFCMYDGKSADDPYAKLESIQMVWQTNPDQVWKNGRYELAKRKLRPESFTAEVGIEGNLIEIGSLVSIQDDTILVGIGDGGEIKEIQLNASNTYVTGIDIDGLIEVSDIDHEFAIKTVHADGIHDPVICINKVSIPAAGFYSHFDFVTPILATDLQCPNIGDIVSFGIYGMETLDVLCFSKKDSGNETFSFVFSPYEPGVYTADSAAIPEFNPKVTEPQNAGLYNPVTGYMSADELMREIMAIKGGTAEVASPDIPNITAASAGSDSIELECSIFGAGLNNAIKYIKWQIDKGNGWEDIRQTAVLKTDYKFNRNVDGFPEAEDLLDWKVRAKAVNLYGKESLYSQGFPVSVTDYGTWKLNKPSIYTRISDRTVTLILSQPKTAQAKEVYGNIRYRVQVKRPDIDSEWFKPATQQNPYENELYYKDGEGFVISDNTYIQTMPLKGQDTEDLLDTLYMFRVCAENEAGVSEFVTVQATALCTNIKDLVKAKETAREAYISELSALCTNLGAITQGAFGENYNMWDLSSFVDDKGLEHYVGKFRAGGANQYLHFDPIIENGIPTGEYTVEFSVGAFHITSTVSRIEGELVVQFTEESLYRLLIKETGIHFQCRDSVGGRWRDFALADQSGFMTQQLYSKDKLIITNQGADDFRNEGVDIGVDMPSENSRVYHFDTDVCDQNGNDDLIIICNSGHTFELVDENKTAGDIDFSPAIPAKAPYSTVGKSLYGQYALEAYLTVLAAFTVDFWMQYIFFDTQEVFDLAIGDEHIKIDMKNREPYFYELEECPMYEEMVMSRMFVPVGTDEEYLTNGVYYTMVSNDYERYYPEDEQDFLNKVSQGLLFEQTSQMYEPPADSKKQLHHIVDGVDDAIDLSTLGIVFGENSWLHVAVIGSVGSLKVLINNIEVPFSSLWSTEQEQVVQVAFNKNKNSFMLDELLLDATAAETNASFFRNTGLRAPFGSISEDDDWFILMAKDVSKVKTNLFKTPDFDEAVQPLIERIADIETRIANNLLAAGMVYVQFPGEKTPDELFGGTWQNISSLFAGNFFRAEGGKANAFNTSAQIQMIQSHNHTLTINNAVVTGLSGENRNHGGLSNSYFVTGYSYSNLSGSIGYTGGEETRPINRTIRIWRRTA